MLASARSSGACSRQRRLWLLMRYCGTNPVKLAIASSSDSTSAVRSCFTQLTAIWEWKREIQSLLTVFCISVIPDASSGLGLVGPKENAPPPCLTAEPVCQLLRSHEVAEVGAHLAREPYMCVGCSCCLAAPGDQLWWHMASKHPVRCTQNGAPHLAGGLPAFLSHPILLCLQALRRKSSFERHQSVWFCQGYVG